MSMDGIKQETFSFHFHSIIDLPVALSSQSHHHIAAKPSYQPSYHHPTTTVSVPAVSLSGQLASQRVQVNDRWGKNCFHIEKQIVLFVDCVAQSFQMREKFFFVRIYLSHLINYLIWILIDFCHSNCCANKAESDRLKVVLISQFSFNQHYRSWLEEIVDRRHRIKLQIGNE